MNEAVSRQPPAASSGSDPRPATPDPRAAPRRWCFPAEPRHLPGSRAISIAFRTVHLAALGFLIGGHAFGIAADRLLPMLYVTIGSGVGLIALEVYALGLPWFVMGKGAMVVLKIVVLLLVPLFWERRVALLLAVLAIGSVGSHMPARFRHAVLVGGRRRGNDAGAEGGTDYRETAAMGRR